MKQLPKPLSTLRVSRRLLVCLDCLTMTFRRYVDTAEPTHTISTSRMPEIDDFFDFRISGSAKSWGPLPPLGTQDAKHLVA